MQWEVEFKLPDGKVENLKTEFSEVNNFEVSKLKNFEVECIEDNTLKYLEKWAEMGE